MEMVDLLNINGNILTLDSQNTRAGSISVSNGRISGIWAESEPPRNSVNVTSKTEVINVKGTTLIPGFIDTHNHILMYSLNLNKVDCSTPPNQN